MTESSNHSERAAFVHKLFSGLTGSLAEVIDMERMATEDNGHSYSDYGWHIGWAWTTDESGDLCLDVLREHRMSGASVTRFRADAEPESLDAPSTMRLASEDPVEDARLEEEFTARQRRIVDDLRARGLLPPIGANIPLHDINELLATGRMPPSEYDGPDLDNHSS